MLVAQGKAGATKEVMRHATSLASKNQNPKIRWQPRLLRSASRPPKRALPGLAPGLLRATFGFWQIDTTQNSESSS